MTLPTNLPCAALLLAGLAVAPVAGAKVYRVDTSSASTFARLPRLQPGDVVEVAPGTYREFKKWTDSGAPGKPITIRGIDATRPVIDGTGLSVTGEGSVPRALFQIEGSHVVIENLEFRNGRNGENGAGVRIVGADDTTIRNCRITLCDMGVMSNDNDHLLVERSEIDHNGSPEGFNGYSHNLYLEGNRTTVRFCWIHDAVCGMNFKTRGHYTELLYNWIADSNEGELSLVDSEKTEAPGSHAVVLGNVIVSKADRTGNHAKFIDWGQDMGRAHNGTLFLLHNTLVAGAPQIVFLSSNTGGAKVQAQNNVFYGSNQIVGPNLGSVAGSNNWFPRSASVPSGFMASLKGDAPGFVNAAGRDYHLTPASPCRNAGGSSTAYTDGSGATHSGRPLFQPDSPLHTSFRRNGKLPDVGALTAFRSGKIARPL